jgi:hypothetical protein
VKLFLSKNVNEKKVVFLLPKVLKVDKQKQKQDKQTLRSSISGYSWDGSLQLII